MRRTRLGWGVLAFVTVAGLLVAAHLAADCNQYEDSRVTHAQGETFCGDHGPGCEECTYPVPGGIAVCWQDYPYGGCEGSGGGWPYVY